LLIFATTVHVTEYYNTDENNCKYVIMMGINNSFSLTLETKQKPQYSCTMITVDETD